MTRPFAPLSLPATTRTVSPFLTFIEGRGPGVGRLAAMVQSTSGASEMIFMNRLSRSSRPTGPKMRVPRGSLSGLISTAAFSSNRMYDPSGRRFSLLVRTMTAFTTSPFFTPAPGRASLTVATITSPMLAYRRPEPPSTRMHRISRAPVLSATRSRDSCWITSISWLSASPPAAPELGRTSRACARFQILGRASRALSSGSDKPRLGLRPLPVCRLLRLLEDLHDPPALCRRQWPGLHQQHPVADAARVLLVVRLQLAGVPQDLAVERMLDPVLDGHHHRLVHLVADDQALPDLAPPALLRSLFTHDATSLRSAPPRGSATLSQSIRSLTEPGG